MQDYQYGFFGDLKDLKNRIKQPYTYTAREYDRETGLYFYRARYYDAEAGRFITKDPIGFRGGMNLYAYVGGNPVKYTDPWGLDKGDLIYFTNAGKKYPEHVGIDMGNGTAYMLTTFYTNAGEITTVPIEQFLTANNFDILGYAAINKIPGINLTLEQFIANIVAVKQDLMQNFKGWRESGEGTMCVDIPRAGFGDQFSKLQEQIKADYAAHSVTYTNNVANTSPKDPMFWRRNSTYWTYFRNIKIWR